MVTATLPDGREIRVRYEGPTGNWVASLDDAEKTVAGRWLLRVIGDLLDLPGGTKPAWVLNLVREITGRDTPSGRRYPCPCCDYLTFAEPPTGTFAICPICRWEDDNLQFNDLDYEGGANSVSLRQARENFLRSGVSDVSRRGAGRPPRPEEHPR